MEVSVRPITVTEELAAVGRTRARGGVGRR
jgi:hypothetical protein